MNSRKIVKLSNIVGLVSITLLIYWVFTFLLITVFNLKVFRENLTESFYLSVIGILALMFGSLMISIMHNLSSISESLHKANHKSEQVKGRKFAPLIIAIIVFVLIGLTLFVGDYLSSIRKKEILIKTADQLSITYKTQLQEIASYEFSLDYIKNASEFSKMISRLDKNFSYVSIIVLDKIYDKDSFLQFKQNYFNPKSVLETKSSFIFSSDFKQREYLTNVFRNNQLEYYFSAHDGKYELFYPLEYNGQIIVLYFTDFQRYGKIGS